MRQIQKPSPLAIGVPLTLGCTCHRRHYPFLLYSLICGPSKEARLRTLDQENSLSNSERCVLVQNAIIDQVTVIIGQIQLYKRRERASALLEMCLDNVTNAAQRIADLVNQTGELKREQS
jgi:hypothetical protein